MITIYDNVTLKFSNMGEFVGQDDWIHPEIVVPTYEIIAVTKGVVYIEEDGTPYELHAGDLLCLKPGLVHKGYKKSNGVRFFWLHFYCNDYDKIGVYLKSSTDAYNHSAFFKQLNHLASCAYDSTLIESKLVAFILELKHGATGKNKLFSDVCEYIRVNIESCPSAKSVSDHFGYNPDYLSKIFIKNSGLGLKGFIDKERNALIKNLLLTTTMNLKEIAEKCSFDSDNALIKFFKYNNNLSPTAFRNTFYASHTNIH